MLSVLERFHCISVVEGIHDGSIMSGDLSPFLQLFVNLSDIQHMDLSNNELRESGLSSKHPSR